MPRTPIYVTKKTQSAMKILSVHVTTDSNQYPVQITKSLKIMFKAHFAVGKEMLDILQEKCLILLES